MRLGRRWWRSLLRLGGIFNELLLLIVNLRNRMNRSREVTELADARGILHASKLFPDIGEPVHVQALFK